MRMRFLWVTLVVLQPSYISSPRKFSVNKKTSFSQNSLTTHNNKFSRPSSSTQENIVDMTDSNLLFCPLSNLSGNGVGFSVDPINRASSSSSTHTMDNNSSFLLQFSHSYFNSNGLISDLVNTDFGALNNSILTSSVDLIYNLFYSLNPSIVKTSRSFFNNPQISLLN